MHKCLLRLQRVSTFGDMWFRRLTGFAFWRKAGTATYMLIGRFVWGFEARIDTAAGGSQGNGISPRFPETGADSGSIGADRSGIGPLGAPQGGPLRFGCISQNLRKFAKPVFRLWPSPVWRWVFQTLPRRSDCWRDGRSLYIYILNSVNNAVNHSVEPALV